MRIHSVYAAALGAALLLHPGHAASERDEAFTLDAARAELVSRDKSVALTGSDGLFDRVFVPERKTIRLHLALPALLPGYEVSIAAPNGGKLERSDRGKLHFTSKAADPVDLELDFTPTLGRGAYTITIRQAGAVLTLDLWAGAPNPVGQPGPAYVVQPSTEPETIP